MLRTFIVFALFIVPCTIAADTAFTVVGARAGGLGGAFTAVADDSTAFYWNPAGVAQRPFVRVGFFGGGAFQDWGELVNRLRTELPGDGSELDADRVWGVSTAFTVLGVAVSRFTHTSSTLEDVSVRSRGLQTWDIAASFVHSLPPDDLIIGGNLRYIRGTAYSDITPAAEIPPNERNVQDLMDRAVGSLGRTETEPGVDLGVLYQPVDWIRLGLSARNLNRPTFHTENGEAIYLERHGRAGVAFFLPRDVLVAVDVDISRHDTPVVDGGWREIAAGVEKSWAERRFVLRGGIRAELSDGGARRLGFSAGAGVNISGVVVELTALTSSGRRLGGVWLGVAFSR
jgi:hypothetical protein